MTAVVRDDAYELVTSLLGDVSTTSRARGGTEMTIVLPMDAVRRLFHETGEIAGTDPRYAQGVSDIYDSLTAVVYGLSSD